MNLKSFVQRLLGGGNKVTAVMSSGAARSAVAYEDAWVGKNELRLYEHMRRNIPIVDAAIEKLVQLISTPQIISDDESVTELFSKVSVGGFSFGIGEAVRQMADSALAKGYALAEIVPTVSGRGVDHIAVGRPEDWRFELFDDGWHLVDTMGNRLSQSAEKRIFVLAFDARAGRPWGYSVMWSLAFVQRIMARALQCIENQFWRMGDPTFIVFLKGGQGVNSVALREMQSKIETEFTKVMRARRNGEVSDLFGAGIEGTELRIEVLGGDAGSFSMDVPYTAILEQVVSSLQVPPFMLGLKQYESRETMAAWQADMLLAQIESYRMALTHVLRRMIDYVLTLSGKMNAQYEIEWPAVTLMDEAQTALAELRSAQALATRVEAIMRLYESGLVSEEDVARQLGELGITEKTEKALGQILRAKRERLAADIVREAYLIANDNGNGNGNGKPEAIQYFVRSLRR